MNAALYEPLAAAAAWTGESGPYHPPSDTVAVNGHLLAQLLTDHHAAVDELDQLRGQVRLARHHIAERDAGHHTDASALLAVRTCLPVLENTAGATR